MVGDDPASAETIVQSRTPMAGYFMLAVALIAWGESFRSGAATLGRHTRWPGDSVSFGYFTVATGLFLAAISLMLLIQPAKLILSPSGLTHTRPWRTRSWAWSQLGEFVIERSHRVRKIRFTTGAGARAMLPGFWQINIVQVRDRLNAARERWR